MLRMRQRKKVIGGTIALGAVALLVFLALFHMESDGVWAPDYEQMDLSAIVSKPILEEEDYGTLFKQTGLGRDAVDALLEEHGSPLDREQVFEQYQENFFNPLPSECRRIGIITHEEKIRDEQGELIKGFQIPSLRDGDVLISKSTHSLGWRHGHAAIVTNANARETVEAILWGRDSVLQSVNKWQTYPSFMVLRLKDHEEGLPDRIAAYALETMQGIPYGLLTGIPRKAPEVVQKTQCAHLIWYPYHQFGYDIDSDGSWLVTPKDIANSPFFEVVQVYGMNPEAPW